MSKLPSDEAGTAALTIPTIMDQGTFEFWTTSEHGIEFNRDTPKEAWLAAMKQLTDLFESSHRLHVRVMFMLGDALLFGEAAYDEEYAQAIDMTRKVMQLSEKTINNAAWICASIEPSIRREALTLAHHEQVAALTHEEQNELLGKAESENMTVSALKKEVKTRHPTTKRGKTRKAIIDLTSEEGLHHAMEKVSEWLTEQAKGKAVLANKWRVVLEPAYKAYRKHWQSGHARR